MPRDFGVYLQRYATWQKEVQAKGRDMDYNEIVVDGEHWSAHLPDAIEAFFGPSSLGRQQHAEFLEEFLLRADQVPLLEFDPNDWFSAGMVKTEAKFVVSISSSVGCVPSAAPPPTAKVIGSAM